MPFLIVELEPSQVPILHDQKDIRLFRPAPTLTSSVDPGSGWHRPIDNNQSFKSARHCIALIPRRALTLSAAWADAPARQRHGRAS